jgi:DME family drug/metabolite transporter
MSADAPTESPRRTAGIVALSFATVAWGLVPLILKQTDMPALSFASYRLWMGVLVYVILFAVTGRRLRLTTLRACAPGGVLFAIDIAFTFMAFQLTSVANATIIGALAPVCIAIGAARWFGERVGRRDIPFIVSSFMGVAVVAIGSAGSPTTGEWGDLFAGISVVSWTAYWLFSKRVRSGVGAIEYMASVMLVSAMLVTVFAVVSGQGLAPPQPTDWAWIWLVTLVPGMLGHLMVAWSHRHVEAWLGSLITQSQPIVGSIAAWAILDEQLTAAVIVGGLMVLGSTAVVLVRQRSRPLADAFDEPESPAPAG